jgi:hypothetical protein
LPGLAGIVQDDQHPLPGQQAPVPGRALFGLGRDIRPGHAQGTQESSQRFACRHRLARTIAAQVHVQLAVREPPGHLMRPLERQRRLPYPSRPADRRDHHWPRRAARDLVRERAERGQLVFPADEVPGQPGQFPRHDEPSGVG